MARQGRRGLTASALARRGVGGLSRLYKVYGPSEAAQRMSPVIVSGLGRNESMVISAGTQMLDFAYINDVVEGMLRAADQSRENGGAAIWNLTTGRLHSVRDFTNHVAAVMNADPPLLGFGGIAMRDDDVPWAVGSPDLLCSELGWQPSVSLEDDIHLAVAALRQTRFQE